MTPLKRYQQDLDNGAIQADQAQLQAVQQLEAIHSKLLQHKMPKRSLWQSLFKKPQKQIPVCGLYMWGGVGRGKTYLMDLFYESLPFAAKKRIHFHRFMQEIQTQLKSLREKQNPLQIIAAEIAQDIRVLCLDEFQVHDIADAMILAGLLQGLFDRGVSLITTSNTEPKYLYQDGLQRDRFLPAIGLIEQHTNVLTVDGGNDYRLRALNKLNTWLSPIDEHTQQQLKDYYCQLCTTDFSSAPLSILDREINVVLQSEGIAWFEFDALCDGPRSQADYIELSKEFHTIIISNIPVLNRYQDDKARRFIELIDEIYDRHVNLIASAHTNPTELYQGVRLTGMFERTASRLIEMQSQEYMALEHKA